MELFKSRSNDLCIGVACLFSTVTRHDDVAGLGSNPGVVTGDEERITGPTDRVGEVPGEAQSVALGNSAGPPDVLAGPLVTAFTDGVAGHRLQSFDAFASDSLLVSHRRTLRPRAANTFRTVGGPTYRSKSL